MGKDHVGDVPLSKKILAGLTTGEQACTKSLLFKFRAYRRVGKNLKMKFLLDLRVYGLRW